MHSPRPSFYLPAVSFGLILVNVLLFAFELTRGVSALNPAGTDMIAWGANVAALTLTGDAWRLFTSMFLHIGLLHIFFNMYMLYVFGPLVEDRFGSTRFALVYLLSGLFGSLVSALWHADGSHTVVAAGASGALMGISGAYVGHWLVAKARNAAHEELNLRPLMQTIAINLVLGYFIPGVDNACHVGGLVSGVVLGVAFALAALGRSSLQRALAGAAVTLASLWVLHLVLQRPVTPEVALDGAVIRQMQKARASAGDV